MLEFAAALSLLNWLLLFETAVAPAAFIMLLPLEAAEITLDLFSTPIVY